MVDDENVMWVTLKLNGSETPTTARKMYVRDAREFAETLINFDESSMSYEALRHCGGMLKDIGVELLKKVEKVEKEEDIEAQQLKNDYQTYLNLKEKFENTSQFKD